MPGACSPSRSVVSKIKTSGIAIRRFRVERQENAADLVVRGAVETRSRLIVSCRRAADPSLTDKDGKQDAKEDDDEKNELHVVEPVFE